MNEAPSSPWRVVFMGTPDFAVPALKALHHDARFAISLVVSQPSRPAGRGKKLTPPPVAQWAMEQHLPLLQVEKVRSTEALAQLKEARPDFLVVIAFGQILPQPILDLPTIAPINVHASLLPRWRGAAPIQRAIEAGDRETGVQIMHMEAGLDTGPVYATAVVDIGEETTGGALHDTLSEAGARILPDALCSIAKGLAATPQSETGITWASKLSAADRVVNWSRDAFAVARHINAMSPWPGARTHLEGAPMQLLRARVWEGTHSAEEGAPGTVLVADPRAGFVVQCGAGAAVQILEVQRPGKRPMAATTWLAGTQVPPGARCS